MKELFFPVAVLLLSLTLTACTAKDLSPAATATVPAAVTEAPAEAEAPARKAEYRKITAEEAKARMDSGDPVVILDVRTQGEYDSGHIPGAVLLPNETIGARRPELLPDLDAEILVYCRSGSRSRQAAGKLVGLGYTGIYDFGGIISWPYEVVTEAPATEAPAGKAEYRKITAEEAKARMDSGDPVVILDVRTQGEYDGGHIPGAVLLPNETIGTERSALLPDLDAEILVYCRSGNRSRQAAQKLVDMGYTGVYDFGGIGSWPYEVVTE